MKKTYIVYGKSKNPDFDGVVLAYCSSLEEAKKKGQIAIEIKRWWYDYIVFEWTREENYI